MCIENQCCALAGGERCSNPANKSENHCSDHFYPLIKLYREYKVICDKAYKMDVHKKFTKQNEQVQHLLKCYSWFTKAYEARMKHRKIAFVPECYDEGHDFQFTMLKEKIKACEDIIASLVQNEIPKGTGTSKEPAKVTKEVVDKEYINDRKTLVKNVQAFKKQRKENEKELNQLMDHYIFINKIILAKRKLLHTLFLDALMDLFTSIGFNHTQEDVMLLLSAAHHLLAVLYSDKYFEDDYNPALCRCGTCNAYLPIETKVGCPCVFNKSPYGYLNSVSEENVKLMYTLVLKESEKIKPIFSDYVAYYKFFGENIVTMKMLLIYSKEKKRVVLREE